MCELVGIRHELGTGKKYLKFTGGLEVECPDEETLQAARQELASKRPELRYYPPDTRKDQLIISKGKGLGR